MLLKENHEGWPYLGLQLLCPWKLGYHKDVECQHGFMEAFSFLITLMYQTIFNQ